MTQPKSREEIFNGWLDSMKNQTADPTIEGFTKWLNSALSSYLAFAIEQSEPKKYKGEYEAGIGWNNAISEYTENLKKLL